MLFVDIVDVIGRSAWGVQLFKSGCLGPQHISHIVVCPNHQFTYWSVPTSPEVHVDIVAEVSLKGLPGEVQLYKSGRLGQQHI